MECGREPGGRNVKEFGECPSVRCFATHGINNGINGGRACWAITGTYCAGRKQGSFAEKIDDCARCRFYQQVHNEEGPYKTSIISIFDKLSKE